MKKVSVIVPVYNVESYIGQCIESVLNQTYENIECIVVDDRGADNSMKEVERVILKSGRNKAVKVVHHEKNRGLSEARNTGIREASGDYLFFLDSDDYISVTAISEMMELANEYNADFVLGAICLFGCNLPDVEYLRFRKDEIVVLGTSDIAISYSESKWYMMAQNKLILKDFVVKNNLFFYPGIYHEDELWSLRLACCANSMAICHEYTYFYRIRSASITSRVTEKHIKDLTLIVNESILLLEHYHFKCLYSPVRTLYLRIIALLNDPFFSIEFKRSMYEKLITFYTYSLRNIFIYPICVKNLIKYFICLIPFPLLSYLFRYVRIWR